MRPVTASFLALALGFAAGCQQPVTPGPSAGPSVVALFDPTATPAVVPTPNNLAFTGGDGKHLNVPVDPNSPLALQDFNKFLNTLDGFPSQTNGVTMFSAPLSPLSATAPSGPTNGAVVAIDLDAGVVLQADDVQATVAPSDGLTLTVMPARRWKTGGHYAIALFGGQDPNGLRGAHGEPVLASEVFFFLRSPIPLVGLCGDGTQPGCQCPADAIAAADVNAAVCHPTVQGLDLATAYAAEAQREKLSPLIDQVLALAGAGRRRADLALVWNFSITTAPEAIFDVARGDVPFPNDALINQTTHTVSLPISPTDPMAPIKQSLNKLDGFSTTAPTTVSVDTAGNIPVTKASLAASTLLINITPATTSVQPTIQADSVMVMNGTTYTGQVAIQPNDALLPDQTRYLGVLTTDAADAAGRPVIPSPPFVLLRGTNPLFDGMHTLVPGVLSDGDAAQLEVLRQAYQPAFAALGSMGLAQNKVAAIWTFTTQSINRPLNALVAYPTQAALPTAATLDLVVAPLLAGAQQTTYPSIGGVVLGTFKSLDVLDHAVGQISFDRTVSDPTDPTSDVFKVHAPANAAATTIEYVLTYPTTPVGGANGAPVAIIQHGLTEWRGQAMLLADAFAAQGWATIAIDVNYHGARSICTADNQCMGTCDMTTHKCTGGFVPAQNDPNACTLQLFTGNSDPDGCRPAVSGQNFVNTADFFESRDNLRQYILDAAQLVRVIQASGAGSLQAGLSANAPALKIDGTQLAFLGQSLGAILGTVYLSAAPQPQVAYLSTVGGHDFEELGDGTFADVVDAYLSSIGVMRDTAPYVQIVNTARWILDPADPFAVGRNLIKLPINSYLTGTRNPAKIVCQQEAGQDIVIHDKYQEGLATQIFGAAGLDANGHLQCTPVGSTTPVSTFWPTAEHGSLFSPPPSVSITAGLQLQAATWISSQGTIVTPSLGQ